VYKIIVDHKEEHIHDYTMVVQCVPGRGNFSFIIARNLEEAFAFYEKATGIPMIKDSFCDGSWQDQKHHDVLIIHEDGGVYDAVAITAHLLEVLNPKEQVQVREVFTSIWL
jgi:hypothetical protein